jgi:hypothetical protein
MAKLFLNPIWNDVVRLTAAKHWLDIGNLAMLLAIALIGLLIVFRWVRRNRKRLLEILEAILAIILVLTSAYLSPVLGDRIGELRRSPRKITASQKATFIKALEGAPHGPVKVKTNELDNESQSYMNYIRLLFDDAGYPGDAVTEMGGRVVSDSSISIILRESKNPPHYVPAIQSAFKKIDIDALAIIPTQPIEWLKQGDVVVFINKKPE